MPQVPSDSPPPYGTIVFDCDSTLASIEGIDELPGLLGPAALAARAEIAALTTRAMAGELPLEQVYAARLERLAPTRAALESLGELYVAHALPGARELFDCLTALDKRLHIVSGGLRQAVVRLAGELGVPDDQVHAVELFTDRAGNYQGFDELSPLARAGGKLEVLRELSSHEQGGGVALIGDGMTDLEAAPAVRRFVAFGGVVQRPVVQAAAVVQCNDGDLRTLLPLLITKDEGQALLEDSLLAPSVRAVFD